MKLLEYNLRDGDISFEQEAAASAAGMVAWDIETSGLDWKTDRIALCQVYAPNHGTELVRLGADLPIRLMKLLSDRDIRKIFHHAMFDVRFMMFQWKVSPRNVVCTKIASKVLRRSEGPEHSLQELLRSSLGVKIDKGPRLSNWEAPQLERGQLAYATNDVVHLPQLLEWLSDALQRANRYDLAEACWAHIPTRARLEIGGFPDVYQY